MDRKKKSIIWILVSLIAAVLLLRFAWVYAPSDAKLIFQNDDTGVSVEDPLSREEAVAIKSILWGKIRWPESLYGFPACGFGRNCAIIIDGTRYMLAWDSCGTLCVEDASSDTDICYYVDISDAERDIIEEIFDSRDVR